LSVIIPLEYFQ